MKLTAWTRQIAFFIVALAWTVQSASAFYDASAGRWINRDPIAEKGGLNLFVFDQNNPISFVDPFGHDNPGCDNGATSDCQLRCCAQHDECFYRNNCTCRSWGNIQNFLSRCGGCNREVTACFAGCAAGRNPVPVEAERYFCPNGPNQGTYYDNYADIPATCWENGIKPPDPRQPAR